MRNSPKLSSVAVLAGLIAASLASSNPDLTPRAALALPNIKLSANNPSETHHYRITYNGDPAALGSANKAITWWTNVDAMATLYRLEATDAGGAGDGGEVADGGDVADGGATEQPWKTPQLTVTITRDGELPQVFTALPQNGTSEVAAFCSKPAEAHTTTLGFAITYQRTGSSYGIVEVSSAIRASIDGAESGTLTVEMDD